jgi:hypothetical protein
VKSHSTGGTDGTRAGGHGQGTRKTREHRCAPTMRGGAESICSHASKHRETRRMSPAVAPPFNAGRPPLRGALLKRPRGGTGQVTRAGNQEGQGGMHGPACRATSGMCAIHHALLLVSGVLLPGPPAAHPPHAAGERNSAVAGDARLFKFDTTAPTTDGHTSCSIPMPPSLVHACASLVLCAVCVAEAGVSTADEGRGQKRTGQDRRGGKSTGCPRRPPPAGNGGETAQSSRKQVPPSIARGVRVGGLVLCCTRTDSSRKEKKESSGRSPVGRRGRGRGRGSAEDRQQRGSNWGGIRGSGTEGEGNRGAHVAGHCALGGPQAAGHGSAPHAAATAALTLSEQKHAATCRHVWICQ